MKFRRPLAMLLVVLGVSVGFASVMWGFASTSAQKEPRQTLRQVLNDPDVMFPSNPNGVSATIGTLPSRRAGYGYMSLASTAFQPNESGYVYSNFGKAIVNANDPPQVQYWSTTVQIPQGAVVTRLHIVAGDIKPDVVGSLAGTLQLGLTASQLDLLDFSATPPSELDIVQAQSYPNTPALGDLGIYTGTVDLNNSTAVGYATIDNSRYAYHMTLAIPANAVADTPQTLFRSVRIEYAMPSVLNLPLVQR